ncbi:FXSXX-COOH protein [Streptosporangiaceae bacterium NEAU-GS5]|nr:FXSXX-COOH protein [Streptosporangiaceae bacterium NEAU-GS5]
MSEQYGGGLIDVSELALSDLASVDDPRIQAVLVRLIDDPSSGVVAGFQSSLGGCPVSTAQDAGDDTSNH